MTKGAVLLVATLPLGLNLAFAANAQPTAAPSSVSALDGVTYQAEVEFDDGSRIVGDLSSGEQTVYPADSGTPGFAAGPDDGGNIVFEDSRTGQELDGPVVYAAGASPDEPLPGESGDVTVGAGEPMPTGSGGGTTPRSETPDGYTLAGTNVEAYGYIYKSKVLWSKLHRCQDGVCTLLGQVGVSFKEYLFGGDSVRWRITPTTAYDFGPAYRAEWEYWCGVNIPSASDITCRTGDDTASPSGTGPYVHATYSVGTDNFPLNVAFGSGHANRAKFPMVREEVSWPGYPPTVVIKFRGWDIREYSGVWKMAPVSGTGF